MTERGVVADRSNDRSICSKSHGRQRCVIEEIAVYEFCGYMLSIGGAPAVTEDQKFAPGANRFDYCTRSPADIRCMGCEKSALYIKTLMYYLGYFFDHRPNHKDTK